MSRKNISDKETKTLIALSGGVCAFPNCGLLSRATQMMTLPFSARWHISSETVAKDHEATSRCRMTTGTSIRIYFCCAGTITRLSTPNHGLTVFQFCEGSKKITKVGFGERQLAHHPRHRSPSLMK